MVNRIDENNYYNTYPKVKNGNIPNTDEKFSLNYNQDELQAKDSEKKDKADKSEKEHKTAEEQSGVRLELSNNRKTSSVDRLKAAETDNAKVSASGQSIVDLFRDIFTTAIAAVKDFFYKIWNEPDKINESVDAKDTEENEESAEISAEQSEETAEHAVKDEAELDMAAAQKMNEERLNREIQPYLRKGDLNQVISLLTDNGKKTVAMNSTLLTYYDRNGKMVEINASDRERILRGDRNTKKL